MGGLEPNAHPFALTGLFLRKQVSGPHRNSEYGRSTMYAIVFSPGGSPLVSSAARPQAPKAIATISSGLVRRHSNVGTSPTVRITEIARHGRSGRRTPSSTATGASAPTSAQSRHTRTGGWGDGARPTRSAEERALNHGTRDRPPPTCSPGLVDLLVGDVSLDRGNAHALYVSRV